VLPVITGAPNKSILRLLPETATHCIIIIIHSTFNIIVCLVINTRGSSTSAIVALTVFCRLACGSHRRSAFGPCQQELLNDCHVARHPARKPSALLLQLLPPWYSRAEGERAHTFSPLWSKQISSSSPAVRWLAWPRGSPAHVPRPLVPALWRGSGSSAAPPDLPSAPTQLRLSLLP
jgi:hypothetical protein